MRVSDSAVFMLLWFAALVDLPEACVFVVVVVVVVGDVMVGASVSAVLMLLCFGALLPSVGLAGGLCFCCCRRPWCGRCHGDSFGFCGVDTLMVGCFALLPGVGIAVGLCFCCCRRRCCWRCHGGSFSVCGVAALMVWCFASQCWTCWRLFVVVVVVVAVIVDVVSFFNVSGAG